MQIELFSDGNVRFATPQEFVLDSPEMIALASLAMNKMLAYFQQLGFPASTRRMQLPPPNFRPPRN